MGSGRAHTACRSAAGACVVSRAKAELGGRDAGPMGRVAGGYMLARVMRGPLGGVRSDSGAWEGSRVLATGARAGGRGAGRFKRAGWVRKKLVGLGPLVTCLTHGVE